jgi:hypothetical protein
MSNIFLIGKNYRCFKGPSFKDSSFKKLNICNRFHLVVVKNRLNLSENSSTVISIQIKDYSNDWKKLTKLKIAITITTNAHLCGSESENADPGEFCHRLQNVVELLHGRRFHHPTSKLHCRQTFKCLL